MRQAYQRGSIRRVRRLRGDDVWEWRYRVRGKMKQEKFSVADFPTEKTMWTHLATAVRLLNEGADQAAPVASTIGQLVTRYQLEYLPTLAKSTRNTDGSMLRVHIEPRWGSVAIADLTPLWPTSMVSFEGHRIRLEVSSSNFPRFDINPNTGSRIDSQTNAVTATQTIWHGITQPSRLVLPIIPHPKSQAAPVLRFDPPPEGPIQPWKETIRTFTPRRSKTSGELFQHAQGRIEGDLAAAPP